MYQKKPKINLEVLSKYTTCTKAPFKCNCCDYETNSPAALNMHWNRKHGNTAAPGEERNQAVKIKEDSLQMFSLELANNHAQPPEPVRVKRKWTRRTPPQDQPMMQNFRQVQFCPCCGTNIAAVNLALASC